MSTFIGYVGDIFAGMVSWMSTLLKVIVGGTVGVGETAVTYEPNAFLMLFLLIPVSMLGINLLRRMLRL